MPGILCWDVYSKVGMIVVVHKRFQKLEEDVLLDQFTCSIMMNFHKEVGRNQEARANDECMKELRLLYENKVMLIIA